MRRFITLLLILPILCGISTQLIAQEHGQHHHGHSHSRNEIGVSGGAIYSFDHKEWGTGAHLHYYRTLGDHSKWSLGGMAEYANIHGSHITVGAGAKYQLTDRFSVGVLPGVTFFHHDDDHTHVDLPDHDHDKKVMFSTHFELVYDLFHWEKFHLGPVVDFSLSKNDSHGMIGIHAAYCF